MDTEMQRKMKPGQKSAVDGKAGTTMNGSGVDFNRLYGDLCRKLLNTPVGEIFSGVVPEGTTNHVTSATGSTSPNNIHPAFPTFAPMAPTQLSYLTNLYNPNSLLMTPVALPEGSSKQNDSNSDKTVSPVGGATLQGFEAQFPVSGDNACIEDMGNVDIQKLVDDFKMTLERYGVSQRFAARFIMHDTSQGNLSFLMEKGRNKKWEELSPRGRIPYVKMKTWLENKDQQMLTLDMLKHSQETKKNSPREAFNRRERFSMFQLNVLCRLFEENSNPPMNIRNTVAERLGIPLDRVNVWFQNQRARGFPARKILQQTLYDNRQDSYLAVDVENMKDRINEVNSLPDAVRGSTDADLYKREMEPNGSIQSMAHLSTCMPASSTATVSDYSVKVEPGDTSFPLDLSSASNLDVSRSSETSSPVTDQLTAGEMNLVTNVNDDLTGFYNAKHGLLSNNVCHINSTAKSVTSGAAKRKRGAKQLQINSSNRIETSGTTTPFGAETDTKRRKVDEMQASESKYTYLLETSDSSSETSNINGRTSDDYNYIIKTEPSGNTDSLILSPLNDKNFKRSVGQEQVTSGNGSETDFNHQAGTDNLPESDKSKQLTNGSTKEELPTKSATLFKAMCASLALTEGNSKDVNLKEPELD